MSKRSRTSHATSSTLSDDVRDHVAAFVRHARAVDERSLAIYRRKVPQLKEFRANTDYHSFMVIFHAVARCERLDASRAAMHRHRDAIAAATGIRLSCDVHFPDEFDVAAISDFLAAFGSNVKRQRPEPDAPPPTR